MISTADFKKGLALIRNGEPWVIVDFQHVKPGKGGAFIRTKLKNVKTGNVLDETYKSGENFEEADVTRKRIQYLYHDSDKYYFMDESYEQMEANAELLGESVRYLVEGAYVDGVFLDDGLIDIQLPKKMEFKVVFAPPGIKGDTASGATKQVEIETGEKINTPLFIKEGDKIRVNTETGDYVERVSE